MATPISDQPGDETEATATCSVPEQPQPTNPPLEQPPTREPSNNNGSGNSGGGGSTGGGNGGGGGGAVTQLPSTGQNGHSDSGPSTSFLLALGLLGVIEIVVVMIHFHRKRRQF